MSPSTSSASAADRAYAVIRDRILGGALPGGALISEGELAADLQVSRTPVREAFLRLQAEGWMTLYPKRGALVQPIAPQEDREVLDARLLVETAAARAACRTPEAAAALADDLTATLDRQQEALARRDTDDFSRIDVEFHQRVVVAGNNAILESFYRTLQDRQRRMTATTVQHRDEAPQRILDQHAQLARHVADRSPDAFADALAEHLRENTAHLRHAP